MKDLSEISTERIELIISAFNHKIAELEKAYNSISIPNPESREAMQAFLLKTRIETERKRLNYYLEELENRKNHVK